MTIHDEARKVLTTDYIAYKQITYKRDNTDTGKHMTHLKAWIQFYVMSRTLDFILNVNTRSEYWMQFYVVPRTPYTKHTIHLDAVLRRTQDAKVTNRFGDMDAVLRRTQDVKVTNKLKIMFKAHCLWTRIDFLSL